LANLFPANPEQARISEAYIAQLNQTHAFDAPVATKVEPGRDFYPAEDRRAILGSDIRPLPIDLGRIHERPKKRSAGCGHS
jgi:hypothetical protein